MNSLAAEAISAQKLRGYEAPLSPVSLPGQFKLEQSSADGLLYVTMDGGAWTALVGGGGGGSLDAAYQIGSQINVTDTDGPVVLNTPAVTTAGGAMLITQGAMAMAAPFVALQIDGGATTTGANALTGLNIDYSLVTGAGLVQGLVYTGPSTTTAKTKGQAAFVLNSRASAMSSFQTVVRNKSATTGSIWGIGWDSTNFEGLVASSVLTGQTHMVTLDGLTNVDALTNNVEVVGINLSIPVTGAAWLPTNGAVTILSRAKNQGAFTAQVNTSGGGGAIVYVGYEAATTILSNMFGVVYDFSPAIGGANQFITMLVKGPTTSAASSILLQSQTKQSAGTVWQHNQEAATALSGAFTGFYIDLSTNVTPGVNTVIGQNILIPNSSSASTRGLVVASTQIGAASSGIEIAMTPSSSAAVVGQTITMAANTSSSGAAMNVIWNSTAGTTGITNNAIANIYTNAVMSSGALTFLSIGARAALTASATVYGLVIDMRTNLTASNNTIQALRVVLPTGGSTSSVGVDIRSLMRAGSTFRCIADASCTLTNVLTILDIDVASNFVGNGQQLRGLFLRLGNSVATVAANTSYCATFDYRNPAGTVAGNGIVNIEVGAATTLTGALTGLECDLSTNVTAGAQLINGVNVTMPASSSASTTGFNVTGIMTAGRFFNGSLAASLSGTFVGCEIDCATGVTSNNNAIIGGRFQVPATSSASAAGVSVISAQTGNSCISVAANGASGAPNGVKVTMAATIAKTGQDGSAFFAAIPGAAACGLAVYPTLDGAYGQNAIQVRREAAVTKSFTESAALVELINTCTFSAGAQTFSQPQVNCGIFSTVNGATHTWSGKILQVIQSVTRSSGTVNLTGRILSVEHTPTGTIATDTTTGMAIVMTPSGSAAVVGQATVMQSNTSSSGCAANFVWNSAAGTNGVTGNGIVNIYTSVTGSSGTLTYLTIRALAASTLTASATITGCDLNLTSNITHGNFAIIGHSISVGASSSGSTRPILVSSTQTGAGSFGIEVELTPGSAASVGGIYVKMGANSSGPAIAITQAGTGAGLAFSSADSGGLGHIQGPAGGSLLVKAGPRSGAGNGRDVEVYGSDGVTAGTGGSVFLTPGAGVGGSANGGVLIGSSLPCYLEMYEMTAPAAGAANTARIFSDDSGGKTRLMVQFATGVAQQIAIEP